MHPDEPSDPPYRFLSLGRESLAYTDEGDGEVALVAIPGLPGSARDFRWFAPALAHGLRLLRVELPGFGRSTRTSNAPMTIPQRADVVRDVLDALGLDKVVLVGHSAGAIVAAHLARHHPHRVTHLAAIASPGVRPHYPLRTYRAVSLLVRSRTLRRLLTPLSRKVYRQAGFPSYLTDAERHFTTIDAAVQDFSLHRQNVAALRCPTLVAWAKDDRLIPAAYSAELARLAPAGPRLCFDQGGHNIQKTRALEIAEALRDFVAP